MRRSHFVSVIMPIRNEADFIARAVRSVLDNEYPRDRMEVLVVDGMSTDGTRDIVERISHEDGRVRLLDNPSRTVPRALNIGLKSCRGDVFIRVDGHAEVERDFLRKSVDCLSEHPDAWVAGGYVDTVADGFMGRAIAAAMRSPAGVGNARFRLGDYEGWVDTLAFGAHHRWVIDKVGYFDEQLVRNQDDEFNLRILLAGGKIWLSQSIRSKYYARSSLRKLWRQYYQYGFWRIRVVQKHKRPATLRQLVPLLFVCSLVVLGTLGLFWRPARYVLAAELILYSAGILAGGLDVGRKAGWKCAIAAPLIFTVLHVAYGLGSLGGLFAFGLLKGKFLPRSEDVKMSR